jgi:hypothetical protein
LVTWWYGSGKRYPICSRLGVRHTFALGQRQGVDLAERNGYLAAGCSEAGGQGGQIESGGAVYGGLARHVGASR